MCDQQLLDFVKSNHSLKLKQVPVAETDLKLICDESLPGKLRPLVPSGHRRTIFNNIDNLSHSGIKSTTRLVTDRYVWPNLKKDIAFWCRNCIDCQKTKVRRHNCTQLQRYPTPSQNFCDVNLDLVVPFQNRTLARIFWSSLIDFLAGLWLYPCQTQKLRQF